MRFLMGDGGLFATKPHQSRPNQKISELDEVTLMLNDAGELGWELTAVVSRDRGLAELFLKRPKP